MVDQKVANGDVNELRRLISNAREYILGTVWSALSHEPKRLDHLGAITEGCRLLPVPVWLISLNHDTVLEKALRRESIIYTDGFEEQLTDEIAVWTDTYSEKVRLVKPHGSVNWYRTSFSGRRIFIRTDASDVYHLRGPDGEFLEFPAEGRPQLLAGTFNKILSYQMPVFAEQILRFHEALREADALVVVGYGFRDKAINTRVIDWLAGDPSRRLVVVHEKPDELIAGSRPAAERTLRRARDDAQLRFVERWVQNTTWHEIEDQLT